MKNEYFVLHKRDFNGETLRANDKGRELYDTLKEFSSLEDATEFALENMHEDPILAKATLTIDEDRIRSKESPYVIAAYFKYKYYSYCMDESDPAPTHEIIRCSQGQLESTLRSIARERPNKIYWGIELKLIS